jgi:glycosyltransferase involved in cell wall biosynthesis
MGRAEDRGMAANAAIDFHEEGFRTDQPRLMGRHAAGEGFLKGFLAYAEIDELVAHTVSEGQFQAFTRLCARLGGANAGLPARRAGPGHEATLRRVGVLMRPDAALTALAWRRRRDDATAWSICGVTHTTASHGIMDSLGELLTAPVEPWDALICTSRAVLGTVEHILDGYGAWLAERLGATRLTRPQLPVIPLGVDCAALDPGAAARQAARARWRDRLGIAPDDAVVLFVGRLSWHAKAHPLPLYQALERAAVELGLAGRLHLVEAGWHANDWIRDGFVEAQRALAPSVRCHLVDGRGAEARHGIWHAADLFCTLSDNIQETFGLTPAEAMAAGLPVIASDWDGYRDTLVDGETALLVPTATPAAGAGRLLAERHEDGRDDYDHYIGAASLATAVDAGATAAALVALLDDPVRRVAMGAAGRARARALLDWSVVIRRYQELWGELTAIRTAAPRRPRPMDAPAHPLRDDPFRLFGHYPTRQIGDATKLRPVTMPAGSRERLAGLRMCRFARGPVGPSPLTGRVLRRIVEAGEITQGELLGGLPGDERDQARLAVGWLLKLGLIELGRG